jgi:photosystem II stability/assembly factor-like uncharacterized protein
LSGFHVLSWTFATVNDGWALGLTTTGEIGCAVIARTTDGGQTWHLASSPTAGATSLGQGCGNCLWGLRFANTATGYAFGGAFFTTTDAGSTWEKQPAPPIILLEASDDVVVRVVSPCGDTNQCANTIQKSTAGSPSWTTLDAPQDDWSQVVLVGRSTIYLLGVTSGLWRTIDGGAHWTHLSDPCALLPTRDPAFPPEGQPGGVTHIAASDDAVAAMCISDQIAPQQAGYQQDVVVSHDDGHTFGSVHPVPQLPGVDHGSGIDGIALGDGNNIVVVGSEGGVQTSLDGGTTWTTTMPQPTAYTETCPEPVGFETSSVGHVVFPGNTMLKTADSGRTWTSFEFF